jgi:disulfide bond formation protein DsbB
VPAALGIIGIILILLGIGAGIYQTTTFYVFSSTPYKSYMVPLIIVGAVFIMTGAVIGLRNKNSIR